MPAYAMWRLLIRNRFGCRHCKKFIIETSWDQIFVKTWMIYEETQQYSGQKIRDQSCRQLLASYSLGWLLPLAPVI